MQTGKFMGAALIALLTSAGSVEAAVIGVFGDSQSQANAAAVAAGHTAINLSDLTAADLAGKDVIWVLNGSNSNESQGLVDNAAAITAWLNGGGKLIVHDRWVDGTPSVPVGSAVQLTRNFDEEDINVPAASPYFGGPITNTNLDNGNSSKHGYASNLPVGTVVLLVDDQDRAVDFSYAFGSGLIYYSSIPLDYYLAGSGPAGVRNAMINIYTPEVLAYVTGQRGGGGGGGEVSEPATLALLGAGLMGLAAVRRRKRA